MNCYRMFFRCLDIIFTLCVPRYSSVNDIREDSTRRQIFVENAIVLPKTTSRGIKMAKKQRCLMPAYGYAMRPSKIVQNMDHSKIREHSCPMYKQ